MSPRGRTLTLVAGLVALAALVRLYRLGAGGLWVDEAYTVEMVRGSFAQILARLRLDDAPPLFYFLQKAVIGIAGDSEAAARLLPAAAGIGAVLMAWIVGRRVSARAGAAAGITFAFSSLAVFYSQQARSYSLLHLLTLCLLWLTQRLRERPVQRDLLAFAACGLALLYTHYLSLWIVVAGVLVLLPHWLRTARGRRLSLWLLLPLAAGALPWGVHLLGQTKVHAELNQWIAQWWKTRPLALAPLYSWLVFVNGAAPALRPPIPLPSLPMGWLFLRWPLWLAAAAGIAGAARLAVARPASEEGSAPEDVGAARARSLTRVALTFALVPTLGLLASSYLVGPSYVVGRTDTLALPGSLVVLALGWKSWPEQVRRPWVRWIPTLSLALWIGAFCLAALPPRHSTVAFEKGSDRELAISLSGQVHAGDALVVGALGRPTLEYYGRRQAWLDRLTWFGGFPPLTDTNSAAVFPVPIDSASTYLAQARTLRERWEREGVRNVWVLAVCDSTPPGWFLRPAAPPVQRSRLTANRISYPMNLLVYTLVGIRPVRVVWEYRQDWVSGERAVLQIPRDTWLPIDSLPPVEMRP